MHKTEEVVMPVIEAGVTVAVPGAVTAVPSVVLTLLTDQPVPEPVRVTGPEPEIALIVPAEIVLPAVVLIRNRPAPCVAPPCVGERVSDLLPVEPPAEIVPAYATAPWNA